jgi:RNA polymerase sigma-70 factor (ECF subfamily)
MLVVTRNDQGHSVSTRRQREADHELTSAAAAGDRRARRELATRLLVRTRAVVFRLTGPDPDAEDLAQAAIIEVLRSARTFRGESSLETWAERIAIRTAVRRLKRRRFRASIVALDSERELVDLADSEVDLDRQRMRARMRELLERLKPKHRIALTLKLALGYSVAEIAALTDAPINTVRNRLRRGRKLLHAEIASDDLLAEWAGSREE